GTAAARQATKADRSFVGLRWIALHAIGRAGLGGGERQPVGGSLLQLDEEALADMQRLVADALRAVEAQLEGKLADEGVVIAARTPQAEIGHRPRAMAEVELANVLQQLLDDALVDQRDVGRAVQRDGLERRGEMRQLWPGHVSERGHRPAL